MSEVVKTEAAAKVAEKAPVLAITNTMGDLWTSTKIFADQDEIRPILTGLDDRIHLNAVQCLRHGEKHGDTGPMRRLIIEIVDDKSGYRREGLIKWMRVHSPMELVKDNVKLTGIDATTGERRPWLIEKAWLTPFRAAKEYAEVVERPVFRDTLMSGIKRSIKAFHESVENTNADGTPKNASKPFFTGDIVVMSAFYADLEAKVALATANPDKREDVYKARVAAKTAQQHLRLVESEVEAA
jgi:hypothetical protein